MQIKIEQELLADINNCLKYNQSQFKDIQELTEYLLKHYVTFHNNGEDLYEVIESYNDTHKEINIISIIDEDLDISTYEVDEDDSDDEYIY